MTRLLVYALGIWICLSFCGVFNGIAREAFITPNVGDYAAHVISTATLICALLIVTYLFLKYVNIPYENKDLIAIGIIWIIMTISFEFLFGHFVVGHTWEKLFADYNILNGRVWSLVLVTTLFGPLAIGSRMLQKHKAGAQ